MLWDLTGQLFYRKERLPEGLNNIIWIVIHQKHREVRTSELYGELEVTSDYGALTRDKQIVWLTGPLANHTQK